MDEKGDHISEPVFGDFGDNGALRRQPVKAQTSVCISTVLSELS